MNRIVYAKNGFHVFIRAGLLAIVVVLTLLTTQAQTIRYVCANGTNTTPASATSWGASTTNLQEAIDAVVVAGTYKPGGNTKVAEAGLT